MKVDKNTFIIYIVHIHKCIYLCIYTSIQNVNCYQFDLNIRPFISQSVFFLFGIHWFLLRCSKWTTGLLSGEKNVQTGFVLQIAHVVPLTLNRHYCCFFFCTYMTSPYIVFQSVYVTAISKDLGKRNSKLYIYKGMRSLKLKMLQSQSESPNKTILIP